MIKSENCLGYESNTFIGRRTDVLRRNGDSWLIARRELILEQNVLLAKNLSILFRGRCVMLTVSDVAVGSKFLGSG